jgi:hypothetical protein
MPNKPAMRALVAVLTLLLYLAPSQFIPNARPAAAAAPIVANGAWTVYHHDDGHTGTDATLPLASSATAGWTSAALDAEVFAEPLVSGGLVYVATLNNSVYALNQADGSVVWHTNLGAPKASGWTCGNVSPQGILGTPVIDVPGNRIYVVTLGSDSIYRLVGLDLATGGSGLSTPIPGTIGTGFDWRIQQQRGALGLRNGYVYVPFGGRAGDCGSYHGWVVGVPTNGTTSLAVFQTPDIGIGIWAPGGVAIDDVTGNVFAATGNGTASGCNTVNQNDAVIRLSPTVVLQDSFMPQDWQANWCLNDQDLGSAGPMLISPNLLFQSGKWGGGFLLNPNNLGGVDGQLFPTRKPAVYSQAEVCFGNHSGATFGSFAYAAPFVYLECEARGLVALNVNTAIPSFSPCGAGCAAPDWSTGGSTTFGPPIVAAGAVWVASDSGLFAYDAGTGAKIYQSAAFGINRFVTPAEAGGHVFVPSHNVIRSFDMVFEPGQSLGGVLSSGPGASAWDSTRTDVFARGGDSSLYHAWSAGSAWSGWQPLGGGFNDAPGAVAWGPNRIDVFVNGNDSHLWHEAWDGTSWSGWQGLGGILTAGPGAASWSPNRLDVFARGGDNQLWHTAWSGTAWVGWQPLGGGLRSGPGAVASSSNRLDVFIQGLDDQLWHKWWDGSSWSGWEALGGIITASPAVSSCAAGKLDVFAVGADGALWRRTYNGATWGSWLSLGGRWTSGAAAVCRPGTTSIDVFARGTDDAVWHLAQ